MTHACACECACSIVIVCIIQACHSLPSPLSHLSGCARARCARTHVPSAYLASARPGPPWSARAPRASVPSQRRRASSGPGAARHARNSSGNARLLRIARTAAEEEHDRDTLHGPIAKGKNTAHDVYNSRGEERAGHAHPCCPALSLARTIDPSSALGARAARGSRCGCCGRSGARSLGGAAASAGSAARAWSWSTKA